MKVFMLKDVENVGMAYQIVQVSDGYALNYLVPRKLAVQLTPQNEASYLKKVKTTEVKKEVIASKTSMLAQRIESMTLSLKKKLHDGDKLYGSVTPQEIADLLSEKGVAVGKNQIEFEKSIKTLGLHKVVVKLSQKLRPVVSVKITAE
jgi:large subunit ribosomal protein L9